MGINTSTQDPKLTSPLPNPIHPGCPKSKGVAGEVRKAGIKVEKNKNNISPFKYILNKACNGETADFIIAFIYLQTGVG